MNGRVHAVGGKQRSSADADAAASARNSDAGDDGGVCARSSVVVRPTTAGKPCGGGCGACDAALCVWQQRARAGAAAAEAASVGKARRRPRKLLCAVPALRRGPRAQQPCVLPAQLQRDPRRPRLCHGPLQLQVLPRGGRARCAVGVLPVVAHRARRGRGARTGHAHHHRRARGRHGRRAVADAGKGRLLGLWRRRRRHACPRSVLHKRRGGNRLHKARLKTHSAGWAAARGRERSRAQRAEQLWKILFKKEKLMRALLLLAAIVAVAAAAGFKNPVVSTDAPDPGVAFWDGVWWMATTGLALRSSPDLVTWTDRGQIFTDTHPPPSWAVANFWAPELHRVNGRWFCVFSASDANGAFAAGGAFSESDSPAGPWAALPNRLVTHQYGVIDVHVATDNSTGTQFLVYKVNGDGPTVSISATQLAADGTHTVGDPVQLLVRARPWEKALVEAPWIV